MIRAPAPARLELRAALAAVCLAAAASLGAAACTYPDFQFGDEDGGGGEGGQGGGPASSSTGPQGPQVHCHVPPVLCASSQVCCLHDTDPEQDVCADAGQCGPMYSELRCNDADDCPPTAAICCAKDDNGDGLVDGIGCQATCDALYEAPMCKEQQDCGPGLECQQLIIDYDGYDVCLPP